MASLYRHNLAEIGIEMIEGLASTLRISIPAAKVESYWLVLLNGNIMTYRLSINPSLFTYC